MISPTKARLTILLGMGSLLWRHGISNDRKLECLFNRIFQPIAKGISKHWYHPSFQRLHSWFIFHFSHCSAVTSMIYWTVINCIGVYIGTILILIGLRYWGAKTMSHSLQRVLAQLMHGVDWVITSSNDNPLHTRRQMSIGFFLTHLLLISHICASEWGQHWFRYWLADYSAPSHNLNQCWNIINWIFLNRIPWNLNRKSYISIQENASEYIVYEIAVILSKKWWVKLTRRWALLKNIVYGEGIQCKLYSICNAVYACNIEIAL